MNCNDLTVEEEIAGELEDVDFTTFLVTPAVVERYATIKDGSGGRTESWVSDSGMVMVNIVDLPPMEQRAPGDRFDNSQISHQIKTSRSVVLRVRDRIAAENTIYEVMGVMNRATLRFLNIYYCKVVGGF